MRKLLRRKRLRVLAACLFLLSLPVGGALAVQWQLYRQNLAVAADGFPRNLPISSRTRALVIAPHCDDETLGCGGTMAEITRRGGRVSVVAMTNGDGSRSTAVSRYHRLRPSAAQIVEMAEMRQKEMVQALAVLGVPEQDAFFLGYPDGGLEALWDSHWSPRDPYRSRFSRIQHNPYPNSQSPGLPYCGESVLGDLQKLIKNLRPTDIFVSHPNDTHGDHWATFNFVSSALETLRVQRQELKDTRVWCYLIHRDGGLAESVKYSWPAPIGLRPDLALVPPGKLLAGLGSDASWRQFELSDDVVKQKHRALLSYQSQLKTMRKFMLAFVRKTELFSTQAAIDLPRSVGPTSLEVTSDEVSPVVSDATADGFARDVIPQGDVRSVRLLARDQELAIRVTLYAPPSRSVSYYVELNGVDRAGELDRMTVRLIPGQPTEVLRWETGPGEFVLSRGASSRVVGNSLIGTIPADLTVQALRLLVCARTRLGRVRLDRTGMLPVRIEGVLNAPPSPRRA